MPDYRRYRLQGGATSSRSTCSNGIRTIYSSAASMCCERWCGARTPSVPCGCLGRLGRSSALRLDVTPADDFTNRWRLIKQAFSRTLPLGERRSAVRIARGESQGQASTRAPAKLAGAEGGPAWRAEDATRALATALLGACDPRREGLCCPYRLLHINPVKNGYVERVSEWPYSAFHRYVTPGIYPLDWAGDGPSEIEAGERNG